MGLLLFIRRRRSRTLSRTLFRLDADPRETPIYSVLEAAAYVGVPRSTLRHWLAKPSKGRAIIEMPPGAGKLSFYNLMEAHILRAITNRDVPLVRLRKAVNTLRDLLGDSRHPLLEHDFHTAKKYRSVFIREASGEIVNLAFGGQYELRKFLERHLQRIDRDAQGRPFRLRPLSTRHIVIDHRVSGGRPVVLGTGVLAEVLAARNKGGESAYELARDYGLAPADVKEAIRYYSAA